MPRSPSPTPPPSAWLNASQAATLLGVQRSSLYSYVSRGLLRAHSVSGQRGKHYLRADVLRLAQQRQAARNPARLARATMDWGQPVLVSAITLVQGGRLFYRGEDAVQLSSHASLEAIAALLWQQKMPFQPDIATPTTIHNKAATRKAKPVRSAAQALAAWHAMGVHAPGDAVMPAEPWCLLHQMCDALTGTQWASSSPPAALHLRLAQHWGCDTQSAELLRSALVLCADHELNASSFATRVVASTGAGLHACVGAGLAALSGPLHGGMTERLRTHWSEWLHSPAIAPSLQALLEAGSNGQAAPYCSGFGHPLYPAGDPRSACLLAQLPHDAHRERLLEQVYATTGLRPSLDFGLVAVEHALTLPGGAAFVLFALGRCAGWIAHALEQQATGQLIRPRAHYTGVQPADGMLEATTAPSGRIIRF